jgi:hypothetical protein
VTFSPAARDPATGAFGMVLSSSSPAVAARCLHLRPLVGRLLRARGVLGRRGRRDAGLPQRNWAFRHHGGVSNNAELAAVLRRIAEFIGRDDVDTSWSSYEADELRSEIGSLLHKAETGLPFDEAERGHLQYLFAVTGPLQETAMSSGWAHEYLALAERLDKAMLSTS